jgi:hypothetical protein
MADDPVAPVSPLTVFDDLYTRDVTSDVIIPDDTTPIVSDKPERLYAYTDPNPSTETLYAWVAETQVEYFQSIVYTTTDNPDTACNFYDENGNEIVLGSDYPGTVSVMTATPNSITVSYKHSGG